MFRKTLMAAAAVFALGNTAEAATEITWWHAMDGALGGVVDQITADFNASQSDYHLVAVNKGGYEDTMTAGIAAFRAKNQPNIIQIFDAGAATIINAKGAVKPVQDLLEENNVKFDINDYIPGVRYFYADSDGKMIGMPFNSSTPLLYYNKEALAKAGVDVPKTWQEFEEAAPKLKEAGYIALAQSHSPWIFFENFMSRHNLQMATANNGYDSTDVEILYNNDALKDHWQHVKDWKDAGYYGYYGRAWGANQDAFVQQQVAMWIGSSGSFGGLRKSAQFDFGTSTLPYWKGVGDAPKSTFIGGASLFAFSGHSAEEDAGVAAFFQFLTKPETQYYWHKETGYVPITNAAYELAKKDGYYKESPDAEVGIQQLSEEGGDWTKGYRLGFYVQIREVIYREVDKIMNGEETVDAAFNTIEEEANGLLKRFNDTYSN
ncbi:MULTISPECIES: extracellular solute-binding protein [Thalassospira]|jgi:sn-glycerol 3-phosphate transport system substrate-binding protein|uniref:sn-glycerol-3-phosphate-binding periplasmic protein UgpB n=1 Tax=Thalassospira povalilytica TaxID=732237 RepID=A0A8I1SK38_9PROT|nr:MULTISPECIES: extracellular solute-binding protein [Thalassospira]MEE3044623.1 extracellular solute-binding protein [Pseudomonadota bacterium]RCK24852.1 glycerol 3-phosphate ABC transporter substrate-binding protein [Thalassospira profundimaris]KZB60839.1 glycerol 3-phosphate ABC transporter substrate-binding protein [Thalassospira sp. MCCC 1A02491]MAL39166.1 ABC transporter substrate-binding protein [Thalassospira sp.]MBN8197260.1 extracellular solute-binding protein [Thalassospira povalil|eukprot:NODE_713_length_1690_cov_1.390275_g703_i0.p1 GENE.NODE_713_length_1690_cov_1.390275_g703_i0~~NODE_713_length_1690_cov_1.390275_g703_i0.p1  ORF type:complete len:433 (-),score=101.49 NODE_713_length_1690_cov_1.390275_g703_i0:71-1369(-)